ncbi:MAG: DUF6624 domain-containing protein, partial [Acidimicrobiia bacterium]
ALDHLEIAVEFGDAPALHAAALEDRIRMREGRAQRYGTQVVPTADNRSLTPWPIEDPEHVEGRRAALGLEPLAEHLRALNARFH